ncbi:cysteinyl-tRNA synthetase [Halorubrum aquaticum]|uniref:Cysteine--tRNA ligase n=1 Tax=Halorubrum aquaticum TaxID=387340 RepID=A0A1I3CKW8_9EURY|nr:cysteine--tRNA ligase [Halorubrum aquaticum]SFH75220.1 cysteinyl-tRNA synthetase [Halorubrum aquaticum]
MSLVVTDTLADERVEFTADGDVTLYVCGLTVSDDPHLGHARLWFHADVLHRWLEHLGYDVRHVENVTDVNEKITARVGEREEWDGERDVAEAFTASTFDAMRGLNLLRAEVYPRVTEHVPEIVDLVETLVEKGYAYESNGSVYFDVTTFDDYGKLSNQDVEELEAQGEPDERSEKRNPADFALWKAGGVSEAAAREHAKHDHGDAVPEGETWESPWGEGRPGWHVECSAMSTTHLGETLDVHMGGRDLVFPHHENEIAQSTAATGEEFVRHWLHVGLLSMEGEKMSSSIGNFWTVPDALEELGVNVVRTFYAGAAYRSEQALTEETIAEAEERFERLSRAHERAVDALDSVDAYAKTVDEGLRRAVADARDDFAAAMNDDLNLREATAALLALTDAVNRHVDAEPPYDYRGLREAVEAFEELGGDVLGLQFDAPTDGDVDLAGELVELILDVREAEREAGNYERADELRDALREVGVEIEDDPDGASYRFE